MNSINSIGNSKLKEIVFKSFSEFNLLLSIPSYEEAFKVMIKQNPQIQVSLLKKELKIVFKEITLGK